VPRRGVSFVFTNGEGRPLTGDVLTHDFIKLVKSSGIKHASIHTLRHTFASHLVMSGADLYTVQKLLGHSSIKTTETYAHLAPNYLRSAIEKLRY
jgi:site-specific recombinase XerD